MHPNLFRFGMFEINSYSVMLAIAFAAGGVLAARRAAVRGIDPRHIARLTTCLFVAAIVGSRFAYALVNYRDFARNLLTIYHNGVFGIDGLVMNGGIVLALVTLWAYARVAHLPVLRTMDLVAPPFALGMSITRVGCFLNGCCFGRETGAAWGVVFPPDSPAGRYQRAGGGLAPIHPTQLYCALAGLAIFAAVLLFERKCRRKDGAAAVLVLTLYAATRFLVEFYRYNDDNVGLAFGLTHNQYVAAALLLAGAAGAILLRAGPRPARSAGMAPAA